MGRLLRESDKAVLVGTGNFKSDGSQRRASSGCQHESGKAGKMTDLVNLLMLIAASIGSLAFGVLAAYGLLRAGFALMRPQRQGIVVKAPARVAQV